MCIRDRATIAILEVVRLLVIHEESWTGGSSGISLPLNIGWAWIVFREKINYVIIAFGLFLLVTWVSWYIRKSRIGHYLIAIREREDAALAVGIHTVRVKIIAAVVSAMLTSVIGTCRCSRPRTCSRASAACAPPTMSR